MMDPMRETTYHVMGAHALPVDPDGGGNPSELHLVVITGMLLPLAGPDGNPIQAPFDAHKFPISKEFAVKFFREGLEAAENLKDKPKVDIATSMDGVADLAEMTKRFK